MAALIAAHRAQHRIPQALSCRALGVSQSWFYKWRTGVPSKYSPVAGRIACS